MNKTTELLDQIEELESAKRDALKSDLKKCTAKQQDIFKRMYAPWTRDIEHGKCPTEEMLAIPMGEVVDKMPEGRLDWAMQQVSRSLEKADQPPKP